MAHDNEIKIAVTTFEKQIAFTDDHVFYGILKRHYKNHKYTVHEWFELLANIKNGSVVIK